MPFNQIRWITNVIFSYQHGKCRTPQSRGLSLTPCTLVCVEARALLFSPGLFIPHLSHTENLRGTNSFQR
jgi:hypothetical protein